MPTLYNADKDTFEYMAGCDTEAHENPMYNAETHDVSERYIYNRETSSLVAPPQSGDNERVYLADGVWTINTYFVGDKYWDQDGNEYTILAPGETVPAGKIQTPPPSSDYTTNDGTSWIFDLDACKERLVGLVSAKRREAIDNGVTVDGRNIQSDDASHANMGCYVTESITNGMVNVAWECSCGADHIYTMQEMKPVFCAVANYRNDCFARARELKASINASSDPLSLESDIETGWPSTTLTTP